MKIKDIKNKLINEDVFILGNAPSIKNNDLSLLKNKNSIGINASTLLEKEFGFHSKYYTVSDLRFLSHENKRKFATELIQEETIRVFRKELKEIDEDKFKKNTLYIESLGKNGFSFDLNKGYFFGSSTTMLAIQLAYYLGAKRIFILGVDLNYEGENARFYNEEEVQEYDSFTSVQLWNIRNAYLELSKKGVELFNCSNNSLLLPYLPYISFTEAVGKG